MEKWQDSAGCGGIREEVLDLGEAAVGLGEPPESSHWLRLDWIWAMQERQGDV
jgi:hypothetical protein